MKKTKSEKGQSLSLSEDFVIELSGVSVKYVLTGERPGTLQEFLIGLAKGRKGKTKSFYALDDISFTLRKGESLGIIGENGAGKSTLLKVIAGVIKPTSGSISVRGKIAPLIELGTGFDMELTGRENIYLNASILGLSRRAIDRKFDGIVGFAEVGDFINSPLRNYSSGMIARLAFSVAVEVEADILVVDEVLSVGDEGFKKKCQVKIDESIKRGITLLFVSHAMGEVQKLCDSIIWLEQGKILASADSESVSRRYLLHFEKTVFEDIKDGHPYKKYIDAMFMHGLTVGYNVNGKRYYNPENKISRAEFAVFVSKALGMKKNEEAKKSMFADVADTHWASKAIGWFFERGLTDGASDEKGALYFYPDDYVTSRDLRDILSRISSEKCRKTTIDDSLTINRGEIARILYNFFDYAAEET